MKISVIAHPKSSQQKVILKEEIYHIYIHSVPEKGKANKEIMKLLSKHFKTAKSNIKIISGETSKNKMIEIQR